VDCDLKEFWTVTNEEVGGTVNIKSIPNRGVLYIVIKGKAQLANVSK